jgi:hypothetical protein
MSSTAKPVRGGVDDLGYVVPVVVRPAEHQGGPVVDIALVGRTEINISQRACMKDAILQGFFILLKLFQPEVTPNQNANHGRGRKITEFNAGHTHLDQNVSIQRGTGKWDKSINKKI